MKQLDNTPYASHEKVLLLLPWHINKTLSGEELDLVEQHLKVCLTCKRELNNLQSLAAAVKQADGFNVAPQASFAQLQMRLQNSVAAPTTQRQAKPYKSFKLVALAASVILVVLLPSLNTLNNIVGNDYRTLSNAEPASTPPHALKVIFKAETGAQTIAQILASVEGHVIDGPNEQALYTIGFKQSDAGVLKDKLAALRKQTDVIFAEPSYAFAATPESHKAQP
ncbi:hypothetical protein JCM14076_28910 [Methylosoma difficile]